MQSHIVIRIVSWPLHRDTYRIVTLLVIHSTNFNRAPAGDRSSKIGTVWSPYLIGLDLLDIFLHKPYSTWELFDWMRMPIASGITNTDLLSSFCSSTTIYCFFQHRLIEKKLPTCKHTIPCSFQLKWTLVAVKHQQYLFLFTKNYDYSGRFQLKVQYVIFTASGWNGYRSPNSKY